MSKKKILVVEDETDMRTMLVLELKTSDYEVFQAADGEEGFKIAEKVKPDLILSDVMMPKMDGNQLMKQLRASEFGKEIPFIVLTARGQLRDYFEVMEVDDFIRKPFDAEDLLTRVERILYRQRVNPALIETLRKEAAESKRRILMLDNDAVISSKLQEALEDYEKYYEIKIVTTVPEFFEMVILFKPHIITTRFILNELDADKLIKIVRGMPHIKNIPIIVYSHDVAEGEQRKVLQAGASCFIGKINNEKLLSEVYQQLNKFYPKKQIYTNSIK